jgi:hypothetical protein
MKEASGALNIFDIKQYLLTLVDNFSAEGCRSHAPTVSVKQPHIEQPLQGIQTPRQCGLSDVQDLCSLMHVCLLRNDGEMAELF